MDCENENKVIIRESFRINSMFETVVDCIVMIITVIFTLGGLVIAVYIAFSNDRSGLIQLLIGMVLFGGLGINRIVGIATGRIYAIISDEGITVRGSFLTDNKLGDIIPWENVREVTTVMARKRRSIVGVRYLGKDNGVHLARIPTRITKYSTQQVIDIINERRKKCD